MNSSLEGTAGMEIIVAGSFPVVVLVVAFPASELAGVPARVCDGACVLVVVMAT